MLSCLKRDIGTYMTIEKSDNKKEQERIAAKAEEERKALLAKIPAFDEADESLLICNVYFAYPVNERLYIPGDPDFPGPDFSKAQAK